VAVRLTGDGPPVATADLDDEIQALGGKAIARSCDITDAASYK